MQKTEVLHSKNVDKLKESSETSNQRSNDRISVPQEKSSGRSANISNGLDQSFQQGEKSGIYGERLDASAPEGKRSTQTVVSNCFISSLLPIHIYICMHMHTQNVYIYVYTCAYTCICL